MTPFHESAEPGMPWIRTSVCEPGLPYLLRNIDNKIKHLDKTIKRAEVDCFYVTPDVQPVLRSRQST